LQTYFSSNTKIVFVRLSVCFQRVSAGLLSLRSSRSVLQTDQRDTALSSETGTVKSNSDGSIDIYFGPTAPAGKESNWIQTVPGKGWFTPLRLYGALEPWFDKTWRPERLSW
jgi:hypothetical protein